MSVRRAIPIYTVDDLERTLAWYRDVMGCEVGETFEEEGRLDLDDPRAERSYDARGCGRSVG